jgi:hypothetical protein
MKRKSVLIIASLFLICLTYGYFKYVHGWMEFHKKTDTPKDYLSNTVIKKEDYIRDSVTLLIEFQKFLRNHQNSFYKKEYFDSTQLIIDTIMYSPDFNKVAVFVITKNPTFRQLTPNKDFSSYYDAYCYLGIRLNDGFNLKWLRRFYPINWYDRNEISNEIRDAYFNEFSVLKDINGLSQYKYNLNDKRFWECPVWKEYF